MKSVLLLLVFLWAFFPVKGHLLCDSTKKELSEADLISCLLLEINVQDCFLESFDAKHKGDTLLSWKKQLKAYDMISDFLLTHHLARRKKVRDDIYDFLRLNHTSYRDAFIELGSHPVYQQLYAEYFLDYLLMYYNYNLRSVMKQCGGEEGSIGGEGNAGRIGRQFYRVQEIRESLQDDEVAVHLLFCNDTSLSGCYIFVISPATPYVLFLPMDRHVSVWLKMYVYNIFKDKTTAEWVKDLDENKGIGAYLHAQFPALFEKARTVYIAGNGMMNLMPYALSKLKEGEYMLERWNFHLLTSLNEIPELRNRPSTFSRSAALWGDMQYYSKPVKYLSNMHTRGITTRGDKLQPLPYSRMEVDSIENLLQANRFQVMKFTRQEASEESLTRLGAPSPQILHFSTHAFFMDNIAPLAGRKILGYNEQEYLAEYGYGQGLFFSNSGVEWNQGSSDQKGIPPRLDNILTAYEISRLDLSGTDLVVLSACDTGQGSPETNTEYMGLVRAFKIAGAKSVLMSLWEVDDEATGKLMILFYKEWLKGTEYHEAFRRAQLQMSRIYSNPYYWAGFVLMD